MTLAATRTETDEGPETNEFDEDSGATTRTTAAGTGDSAPLSKDVIFGLLSVERRRQVLVYLDEHDGTGTLGDVAEYIAARENDVGEAEVTSTQRKRVYVALYQSHLPKMADANVVVYDQDRGTIDLGANADQLFPYLYLDGPEGSATDEGDSGIAPDVSELTARMKGFLLQ